MLDLERKAREQTRREQEKGMKKTERFLAWIPQAGD
jgi:hypothetical protein